MLTYAALLHDATQRIAQMIDVCPNLFTLASAASPQSNAERALLERIHRGDKLHELTRTALGIRVNQDSAATTPTSPHAKALVRHLPVLSLEDLLALLHVPGIDVNDLRAAGATTAAWTTYMVMWAHRARAIGAPIGAHVRRLGGFFSRHAVELHAAGHMPDEILDWVERTNSSVPDRTSSPRRVIEAVENWHASLWDLDLADDTPLHIGPTQTSKVIGIVASPIATVGALVDEGARMAHCVASLATDAIEGTHAIYTANVLDVPLTIAVVRAEDRWVLHQASGFANQGATIDQIAVILQWADGLR